MSANQNVKIRSHRDLIAWQKAMDLVVNVYILSKSFPPDELYALTKQVRRAVTSVPANIAEGQGRRLGREFHQFLANARGSLMELDTHLEVACRVGYIKNEELLKIQKDLNEVGRILNGLMRSISASN
jgi:four helix bundle protein